MVHAVLSYDPDVFLMDSGAANVEVLHRHCDEVADLTAKGMRAILVTPSGVGIEEILDLGLRARGISPLRPALVFVVAATLSESKPRPADAAVRSLLEGLVKSRAAILTPENFVLMHQNESQTAPSSRSVPVDHLASSLAVQLPPESTRLLMFSGEL